ncbi:hypothetical protein G6F42_014678 [Rhizopus arrhizus]|nr:hypothetical protein G6F42_014678 [Rhizopus arrhizus]
MSLFVGRLPTHNFDDRDLEDIFYKYGRIINCQLKRGTRFAFGFIEFEDPEDAYDAIRDTDGLDIDGTRIVVEKAKGTPHKHSGPGCYNCGEEGHYARDCRSINVKSRKYTQLLFECRANNFIFLSLEVEDTITAEVVEMTDTDLVVVAQIDTILATETVTDEAAAILARHLPTMTVVVRTT